MNAPPRWPNPAKLRGHFNKHGARLGVHTIADYEQSTLATVRIGRRFLYDDPGSGEPRVGYYEPPANRFTGLTDDETEIVTHFAPRRGEQYVRELPASTYA